MSSQVWSVFSEIPQFLVMRFRFSGVLHTSCTFMIIDYIIDIIDYIIDNITGYILDYILIICIDWVLHEIALIYIILNITRITRGSMIESSIFNGQPSQRPLISPSWHWSSGRICVLHEGSMRLACKRDLWICYIIWCVYTINVQTFRYSIISMRVYIYIYIYS